MTGVVTPGQRSEGQTSKGQAPRVRVVVVDHNGGELTIECLRSLLATDWPAESLDVILVDNGSAEGGTRVKTEFPTVTVVESGSNRGFAGGCNLGMRDLGRAEYVALINNDATVSPDWLRPLVEAIQSDDRNGAASPKILFSDRFVDIHIDSPTVRRGRGDVRALGVCVSGARVDGKDASRRLQFVDGFWGPEYSPDHTAPFQWTSGSALMRVPVGAPVSAAGRDPGGDTRTCELRLSAHKATDVIVTSGDGVMTLRVSEPPEWYEVPLGATLLAVINNVGCTLDADGFGADRGYQEPDRGQYDRNEEVFAWCGAAVLLSRSYIDSVGTFDERFFLYYEDLDLAWRGRAQGWRHVYVPDSVVHHQHSATTVEGSALVDHYVERNRLLTLARNAPARMAIRAVVRQVAITGSYAQRDILSRLAHARCPRVETVRRRTRAMLAFARLLPGAINSRRRLRAGHTMTNSELWAWTKHDNDTTTTGRS